MQHIILGKVCQIQALTKLRSSNCSKSKHCEMNHSLGMLSNTRPNRSRCFFVYVSHTQTAMEVNTEEDAIMGHTVRMCVNSLFQFVWIYAGGSPKALFFFSPFFSFFSPQNNKTNWWRGTTTWNPSCSQLFCFWTDRLRSFSESSRCGRSSASDMYSTGSWSGCKNVEEFYLASCERKKK